MSYSYEFVILRDFKFCLPNNAIFYFFIFSIFSQILWFPTERKERQKFKKKTL